MKKSAILAFSLVIPAIAFFAACRWEEPSASRSGDNNVILVSIDSLRADHLRCYGYERETSPNIDRIAAQAAVFQNAFSQSAWTLPSHASMLTGLLPSEHGLIFYDNEGLGGKKEFGVLDEDVTTLAEILKSRGYACLSYNGGAWIDPDFGLGQGFDLYTWGGRYFRDNVPKTIDWIRAHREEKFFVFLHAYDVHPPFVDAPRTNSFFDYKGPLKLEEITSEKVESLDSAEYQYLVSQYDAAVLRADEALGSLFSLLEEAGLAEKTILILTADHGEMLGEHGKWGHIYPLFEELMRVPLIIRVPGVKGISVSRLVPGTIGILPTVLDLLGIREAGDLAKNSLAPLLRGEDFRFDSVLCDTGRIEGPSRCRAVRTEKWKLVSYEEAGRGPRIELFDLENDPGEKSDVSAQNPAISRELLNKLLESSGSRVRKTGKKTLDPRILERLRSLGYLIEK